MVVRATLLGALLVAAVLPFALAQDAPAADANQTREEILAEPGKEVTFYGHIFSYGRGSPMPMNTQYPKGEADYSIGTSSLCGVPPPAPADNEDCRTNAANEQYWYSTAGFVQVKTAEEWGSDYSLFHNERGLTKDVYLDTTQTPRALYHMSADFHGWLVALCVAACWNWDPGLFQDWVVEATILHAPLGELHSSPSEEPDFTNVTAMGPGVVVIAKGASEPFDMVSVDENVPVAGGQTVWPYAFDLAWDPAFAAGDGKIPYTDNIVVHWEWYQKTDNPAGGQNEYILGTGAAGIVWNVNSGEDYPSNVVLPVRNPIDVELVYPQFIHDKLVLLSVINTPWGSYDIDPALVKLVVKDSSGSVVPFKDGTLQQVFEQSVAHSGHYQPIKPTWVWDYQAQGLRPGQYSVSVEVTNFQHSVTTDTTALFTITEDGAGVTQEGRSGLQTLQGNIHDGHQGTAADPNAVTSTTSAPPLTSTEKSPGLALPLFAAALVALALLRRRLA